MSPLQRIRRFMRSRQWKHGVVLNPDRRTRAVLYVFDCADLAGVVVSSPRFPSQEPPRMWEILELLRSIDVGTVVVGTHTGLRGRTWFAETHAPRGTLGAPLPVGVDHHKDPVAALEALLRFVRKARLMTRSVRPQ